VCFYAPIEDKAAFEYNQFYAQDVRIVRSLFDDVVLATRWSEIPWDADAYLIWWWSWAFVPMMKALVRRSPCVVTGVFDYVHPMPEFAFPTRPFTQRVAMAGALLAGTQNVFVSRLEFERVPAVLATRGSRYVPLVIETSTHPFSTRPRERVLLTISWLHGKNPTRKGVELAIEAHAMLLREHPDLELRIAGSRGDAVPRLEALARERGSLERVRFLGRISHEEKVDQLQRCAAYLQPSIHEGFGVAAAEAMACGAPVIACPVGTLPEVLGPDAYWVAERTAVGVAEAVRRVLGEDSSERCARAAARIRREFNYERRRKGLEEAFRDALDPRSRRAEMSRLLRDLSARMIGRFSEASASRP
jgi:glycosyltransferase involved in cell wall biosynthesis